MSRRGEGSLVPIPTRARAIAPPALPVRIFGLALLLALALLIGAKPAAAKTPCWEKVVQDWYEDSTIDGTYARHCYTDALQNIGEDVRVYGSFEEDVRAALQRAGRNDRLLQSNSGSTEPAKPTRKVGDTGEAEPRPEYFKQAFDKLGPREADSMPVPLMILSGLALLLIAAGAAGLITRRLRARRAQAP